MDRVWVVSRSTDEDCLMLGVFNSATAARLYVDQMSDGKHHWQAPPPGHRCWTSHIGRYRYRIEEHRVRTSAALVVEVDRERGRDHAV